MNLSPSNIMASVLFSLIGLWFFRRGKRETNYTVMTIGMVLMVYTYFTPTPLAAWGVGAALCTGAYFYW